MLPKGSHLVRPNLKIERPLAQVAPKVDKQASSNGRVPIRTQISPKEKILKSLRMWKSKSKATIANESFSIATVRTLEEKLSRQPRLISREKEERYDRFTCIRSILC